MKQGNKERNYRKRCRSITDFCLASLETRLEKRNHVSIDEQTLRMEWYAPPVILHDIALTQFPKEVLVVGDDDELEVCVVLTLVDDAGIPWIIIVSCEKKIN